MSAFDIEMCIRQISSFNRAKDFNETEQLFDSIYHDFTLEVKSYNEDHAKYKVQTVSREQMKKNYLEFFSKEGKLTLVHFRRIGINCIDLEFLTKENKEDSTICAVIYCKMSPGMHFKVYLGTKRI